MGKRDVFKKNIMALTKAKSVGQALNGWKVLRIINLNKRSSVAHCEICGTKFRAGAIMRHQKFRLRVSVGGVCAEMIHLGTLRPSGQQIHNYRQTTWKQFNEHYEDKIARGSWISWIVNNAPQKYANIIADLRYFRATRSTEDMEKLIKYHDAKRLYPSKALVDMRLLRRLHWSRIPTYLTLIQAQKIIDKVKAKYPTELAVQTATVFYRSRVKPYFTEEFEIAWKNITDDQRRSALAIIKFMERDELPSLKRYEKLYEPVKIDGQWPIFVWNPHLGLCIIGKGCYRPPETAIPMIYSSTRPLESYYALSFFKSLQVKDIKDVNLLGKIVSSLENPKGNH